MHRVALLSVLAGAVLAGCRSLPVDNPAAAYQQAWTDRIRWANVVDVSTMPGASTTAKLSAAQAKLVAAGGGVAYFPPGRYEFTDHIQLADGVVLRGATPEGVTDARQEGYDPPSVLVFPRYEPKLTGQGADTSVAFKGIHLARPDEASRVGVVNLRIENGHIHFANSRRADGGKDRLVVGCLIRNAARAANHVPSKEANQHAWQRFTQGHLAAIHVYTAANGLVANNRLPKCEDASFRMEGYRILGRRGRTHNQVIERDVLFDYNNRAGIYLNHHSVGGGGGRDPKGTPASHPWGFRKGLVILNNYVYCSGRSAISFTGDGVVCSFNVIRFPKDFRRHTHTGVHQATGSSTNDNRAVEMRGWRWTVEGNDYVVHRNIASDGPYPINDGEGLMHEGHANAVIRDSRIIDNVGNSYISIYKTAGIDGLVIRGNRIRTPGGIHAIYVDSDRTWDRHYIRNVLIEDNTTAGSGIRVAGAPAEKIILRNNRHAGENPEKNNIVLAVDRDAVTLEGNVGYEVQDQDLSELPLADPDRPSAKADPAKHD